VYIQHYKKACSLCDATEWNYLLSAAAVCWMAFAFCAMKKFLKIEGRKEAFCKSLFAASFSSAAACCYTF